jgi:mannose-6-phosphate isomerase-like protein (cupin superfamily)
MAKGKNFYDEWLEAPNQIQDELRNCRAVARDKDIPWVSTPQDAKVKLMIANELGFSTMGSNVIKAEIPVGWHTGKHRHGEESMHILEGEGFSIIDGQRFDWHKGSTLQIPFWAEHQHFNTGSVPVLTISGMIFDLERFCRVARIKQIETCGPNDPAMIKAVPPETSQYYPDGARAAIHLEQAPSNRDAKPGESFGTQGNIAAVRNQHDFAQYFVVPKNGFRAISVAISGQWIEPPYHQSGKHKHLEAVVYAVEGEGFTEMDGKPVPWEAGDVLYVPPAMWEHQHNNESPKPIKQLRIGFGIRPWFTSIWPEGFTNQRIMDEHGNPIEAGRIVRNRERTR